MSKIVVTGATGHLGRLIVRRLAERMPASRIGASVRDPAKAEDLASIGVRVRRGDFEDAASLESAFEGATQVLLVSSDAGASGGDPIAQHRTAIEAARAAGAKRIVYTSQIASSPESAFPPALDHAATEAMLADSGLAWTALRNGFYAASGIALLEQQHAMASGRFVAAEDGKFSWAAHEDLAEAAAVVLADEGRFDGPTPPLTGAEALDLAEMCAAASDALGRSVERIVVDDDAMRASLVDSELPEPVVAIAMGLYAAARRGEFAAVDPTLEALIGRPPVRIRELLARAVPERASA